MRCRSVNMRNDGYHIHYRVCLLCLEVEVYWGLICSERRACLQELQLPLLFEKMEELKQVAGVEEYSISQTTLEHVFVQLAQQ
jgi:hypothetical protein